MSSIAVKINACAESGGENAEELVEAILEVCSGQDQDAALQALTAISSLNKDAKSSLLSSIGWEILDSVARLLHDKQKLELHPSATAVLEAICDSCTPREIYLSLLGQLQELQLASDSCSDARLTFVRLLHRVLLRLPRNGRPSRASCFGQCFGPLVRVLDSMLLAKLTHEESQSTADLLVVEAEQRAYLAALADFVEPFIQQRNSDAKAAGDAKNDAEHSLLLGFVFDLAKHHCAVACAPQTTTVAAASAAASPAASAEKKGVSGGEQHPFAERLVSLLSRCQPDLRSLSTFGAQWIVLQQKLAAGAQASGSVEWSDDEGSDGEGDGEGKARIAHPESEEQKATRAQLAALPKWSMQGIACTFLLLFQRLSLTSDASSALLTPASSPSAAAAVPGPSGPAALASTVPAPSPSAAAPVATDSAANLLLSALRQLPSSQLLVSLSGSLVALLQDRAIGLSAAGLMLAEQLIQRAPAAAFSLTQLEDQSTGLWSLFQLLTNFMVQCPDQSLRSRALRCCMRFTAVFSPLARYQLLTSGAAACPFPSVAAQLLYQLKEETARAWPKPKAAQAGAAGPAVSRSTAPSADGHYSSDGASPFVTRALTPLLSELLSSALSEQQLLHRMDTVTAALNFYRFLLLADNADQDLSGVFSSKRQLRMNVLDPLQTTIRQLLSSMEEQAKKLQAARSTEGKGGTTAVGADPLVFAVSSTAAVSPSFAFDTPPSPFSSAAEELESVQLSRSRVQMLEDLLNRVMEIVGVS